MTDHSNGYEQIADHFVELRTQRRIGQSTVQTWAASLAPTSRVLDLGCGDGVPVSEVLFTHGFDVYAIDASPRMVAAYRARFPAATVQCEAVETSTFFAQTFDAIIAVGLVFLLPPSTQAALMSRVANALRPQGQFMFTATDVPATWTDMLTGRPSESLGREAYRALLTGAGLTLTGETNDEGGNHYYIAAKNAREAASP
jgi:2-polyprenyl-3-methyl-5-hydroxy-6-metoxy-1,4-benzoquinol methylase